MEFGLDTPALLFPAISLLMLAYTNRFLSLASLIRSLHANYQSNHDPVLKQQIENLRLRVKLIRNMQGLGVLSLMLCVVCMFVLFAGYVGLAKIAFGLSLILMMLSLAYSVWEIHISVGALDLHLRGLENEPENIPPLE